MNDKERILTEVISSLRSTITLCNRPAWTSEPYKTDGGGYYVHFAPWKEPERGDLVLCETGSISDFKVGFVHQVVSFDRCIIREIGSNNLCDYGNEKFTPIVGMSEIDLLEGDKYEFYQKVLKAFRRGDEFWHRFGGLHFDGDIAIIWIRERYSGYLQDREKGTEPYPVKMQWTKSTTIKAILQSMIDAGYGKRGFKPPDESSQPARMQDDKEQENYFAKSDCLHPP